MEGDGAPIRWPHVRRAQGSLRKINIAGTLPSPDPDEMKNTAQKFYTNFPFRFKELFRGIAETSGFPEQIQLVNALELMAMGSL